jgi:hypothetical protein
LQPVEFARFGPGPPLRQLGRLAGSLRIAKNLEIPENRRFTAIRGPNNDVKVQFGAYAASSFT